MYSIIKPDHDLKENRWNKDSKVSTITLPYDETIVLTDEEGNKDGDRRPLTIPHNLQVKDLIEYLFTNNDAKSSFKGVEKEQCLDHMEMVIKVPSNVHFYKQKKWVALDHSLYFTQLVDYLWAAITRDFSPNSQSRKLTLYIKRKQALN